MRGNNRGLSWHGTREHAIESMAIACEEYGAKFFANGATPGGILEHPGVVKDPERVRESWNSAFGGSSNSNKVAVLEEGMTLRDLLFGTRKEGF